MLIPQVVSRCFFTHYRHSRFVTGESGKSVKELYDPIDASSAAALLHQGSVAAHQAGPFRKGA